LQLPLKQAELPVQVPSVAPSGTAWQVPTDPATLHELQFELHAVSQQTPSTQKPLPHCPLLVHVWPPIRMHVPPKQAELPVQVPSVAPLGTVWQVPTDPATLHELQFELHAVSQQTPSTQKPLPHCPLLAHVWPPISRHVPPKQAELTVQVPSVAPLGTVWQVPTDPVTLHELQFELHAVSQQTPSTQKPLPHCPLLAHVWPPISRHVPPKQAELTVQVPSVAPLGTVWHVPTDPATLHELQFVLHEVSQHTPSTQLPLPHWPALEQIWPLVSMQLPPKQADVPVQVPSAAPLGTVWQIPMDPDRLQELQFVLHVVSQHTPSTQFPLPHWPPPVQIWPLISLQLPPKQAELPEQVVPSLAPLGTVWQVPTDPATLQELQFVLHVVSQHTPSTQFPLPH